MAKVTFGPTIAEARNKVGAQVYSRNQWGSFVRSKITPINPKTPAQISIRADLRYIRQRWSRTLSDAQRLSWTQLQSKYPETDVFKQAKALSADLWYCRLNLNLALIGLGPMDTPPATLMATNPGNIIATTSNPATSTLTLTPETDCPADHTALIRATRIYGPGRNSPNGRLRIVNVTPGPTVGAIPFGTGWLAKFGPAPAPGVLLATIEYINNNTGARSGALLCKITWAGGPDMLLSQTITLSSAQLLAIHTTPVQLLPAPGSNKIINPIAVSATFHPVSTPYTITAGDYPTLQWGAVLGTSNFVRFDDMWAGMIDIAATRAKVWANIHRNAANYTDNQNQALYISGFTANPTLGDGTLVVTLSYSIDPTT